MARHALQARTVDPMRWVDLIVRIAVRTGVDPHTAEQRIKELARMDLTTKAHA